MRKIMVAIVVVLIALAAWWYVSPIWTLQAMRDAAKNHDAARLSEHVDYPALRENLKADLGPYVMSAAARGPGRAGGDLGAMIASAFLDRLVDGAVSPQGVEALFVAQDRTSGLAAKALPVNTGDRPVIERGGIDTFRVRGKDPAGGALVFRLEGLRWKLVGIDFPKP